MPVSPSTLISSNTSLICVITGRCHSVDSDEVADDERNDGNNDADDDCSIHDETGGLMRRRQQASDRFSKQRCATDADCECR